MGCCATTGRIVLVIFNIIFLLISLALIAVGAILKVSPGLIAVFLSTGLETLRSTIKASGFPASLPINLPTSVDSLPLLDSLAVFFLAFGCILFVISFLACCGACYKWRPLLILFSIIVILIIIIFAVVGGLFLARKSLLHDGIRSSLSTTTKNEYKSNKEGPFSLIMNFVDMQFNCCGMAGPEDYVQDWKTNFAKLPPVCCKSIKTTPAECIPTSVTADKIYSQGCYDKLVDLLEDVKTYAIIVLVLLLLLLAIEVIFAIVIVIDIGQNKVSPA